MAFDLPTQIGLDSDDPLSEGEVGRCGVAIDSLADMEVLFDEIDLSAITTSMTISGPAPMLFAFYMAAAEKQGADSSKLDGTCQTDILKEYIAQKEWLFPPRATPAAYGRHDAFLRRQPPSLQAAVNLRIPHTRGGIDGGTGAGFHACLGVRSRRVGPAERFGS